jgi:hypothetical protein
VLLLAVLDVVLDGLADGGYHRTAEVPPAPERRSPEPALDSRPAQPTYPPRRCALQPPHYLGHAVVLTGAHEDMDEVGPKGQGVEDQAQLLRDLAEARLADHLDHLVTEDVPPILRRELQVQVRLADIVMSSHRLHTQHLLAGEKTKQNSR